MRSASIGRLRKIDFFRSVYAANNVHIKKETSILHVIQYWQVKKRQEMK
jgi:hypothetical protein